MIVYDAHTHMGTEAEWEERKKKGIFSMVCGSTPEEAGTLLSRLRENGKDLTGSSCFLPTFGLHPWHAGEYEVSEMSRYFPECPVIGEIGMDSVWCGVPLRLQERVFREQLAIAMSLKKPVILHTKGQEKAIARILAEYPNRYLVHWYSCGEYLEEYLKLDCYFSVGPDVWWNPAVRNVVKRAPLDKLLLETDGMGAVQWAYEEAPLSVTGRRKAPETVEDALTAAVTEAAAILKREPEALSVRLYRNFMYGFLQDMSDTGGKGIGQADGINKRRHETGIGSDGAGGDCVCRGDGETAYGRRREAGFSAAEQRDV